MESSLRLVESSLRLVEFKFAFGGIRFAFRGIQVCIKRIKFAFGGIKFAFGGIQVCVWWNQVFVNACELHCTRYFHASARLRGRPSQGFWVYGIWSSFNTDIWYFVSQFGYKVSCSSWILGIQFIDMN